jgi:ABC-type polar amino acid transport system ATPase subunit
VVDSRLLNDVGLEGMADRATTDLSGGQLQRLAIASALAREPAVAALRRIDRSVVLPDTRRETTLGMISQPYGDASDEGDGCEQVCPQLGTAP